MANQSPSVWVTAFYQFDQQASNVPTPSTGYDRVFTKSDGLYLIDDSGTVVGPFVHPGDLDGVIYPQSAVLFGAQFRVTAGGWTNTLDYESGMAYGVTWGQADAADADDGDAFEVPVVLAAGTYDIIVLGRSASNRGLIDWDLDGTSIDTGQDWYAGSPVDNVEKTISSVTVTGNGRHLLEGTVNGKNASSSDYTIRLTTITFVRSDYTQGVS